MESGRNGGVEMARDNEIEEWNPAASNTFIKVECDYSE